MIRMEVGLHHVSLIPVMGAGEVKCVLMLLGEEGPMSMPEINLLRRSDILHLPVVQTWLPEAPTSNLAGSPLGGAVVVGSGQSGRLSLFLGRYRAPGVGPGDIDRSRVSVLIRPLGQV